MNRKPVRGIGTQNKSSGKKRNTEVCNISGIKWFTVRSADGNFAEFSQRSFAPVSGTNRRLCGGNGSDVFYRRSEKKTARVQGKRKSRTTRTRKTTVGHESAGPRVRACNKLSISTLSVCVALARVRLPSKIRVMITKQIARKKPSGFFARP